MTGSTTSKLLVLVSGILIGTLARQWLSGSVAQSQTDPAPTASTLITDDRQPSELRARVVALELQLGAMEARRDRPDAGSGTNAESPDASSLDATPSRSASVEYEENSTTFDVESTDPAWAPAMAARIESQFLQTASREKIHATVDVRCRSTTCKAKLTWPDFHVAMQEYMKTDMVGMDCFRQLIMTPPANEGAPYTGEIVLRCK